MLIYLKNNSWSGSALVFIITICFPKTWCLQGVFWRRLTTFNVMIQNINEAYFGTLKKWCVSPQTKLVLAVQKFRSSNELMQELERDGHLGQQFQQKRSFFNSFPKKTVQALRNGQQAQCDTTFTLTLLLTMFIYNIPLKMEYCNTLMYHWFHANVYIERIFICLLLNTIPLHWSFFFHKEFYILFFYTIWK